MKKLMFTAAVAVAIGAFAIESANTVGYYSSDSNFRTGNTMYTPMFAGVGDAEYSIQDIKPIGTTVPDGSSLANAITLQKLTATGLADGATYWWMDYYDDDEEEDEYGWKRPNAYTDCPYTLAPGEGLWVKCPNATTSLQFPAAIAE